MPLLVLNDTQTSSGDLSQSAAEPVGLALIISSSIQSAMDDRLPLLNYSDQRSEAINTSGWGSNVKIRYPVANISRWMQEPATNDHMNNYGSTSVPSAPSAPPIPEEVLGKGPINYLSIEISQTDASGLPTEYGTSRKNGMKSESDSCVICWEATKEGACLPCGHMAGCMSCLNMIKGKNDACPVCRTKIDQVVRLYDV
ncbi:E3 ubiquitin-protein like [Quillaja saponaria]|uniref:E3 ubiquitin-protein like n=1 Tax=Quillaja saponaria TaxID=32244 RepID=A0AAD7Q0M9_QUISA|nr:E3 ubiquitin-protein like [Quillaja saponaria]